MTAGVLRACVCVFVSAPSEPTCVSLLLCHLFVGTLHSSPLWQFSLSLSPTRPAILPRRSSEFSKLRNGRQVVFVKLALRHHASIFLFCNPEAIVFFFSMSQQLQRFRLYECCVCERRIITFCCFFCSLPGSCV